MVLETGLCTGKQLRKRVSEAGPTPLAFLFTLLWFPLNPLARAGLALLQAVHQEAPRTSNKIPRGLSVVKLAVNCLPFSEYPVLQRLIFSEERLGLI